MITVQLNEPDFEYDIHSLVKAFYPLMRYLKSVEPYRLNGLDTNCVG